MNQRGEASVEEILDSIKKVMARDNREVSMNERRRRAMEGVVEPADEDEAEEVFDLAEAELILDESKPDGRITPDQEAPVVAEADELDDTEALNAEVEEDELDTASLVTSSVRSSMQENFAALAMLSEPGARPQIVRSGETSLEGMVREMLRPMLAEWLDKNLPVMVERLVKAEIARIARKRG